RCPSCKFIGRFFLENYKFVYDGYSKTRNGTVANIVELNNAIVWGGLFEINKDNLAALDCYEGFPKYYDKKIVKVKNETSNVYDAWVYFRIGMKQDRPSNDYRRIVLEGAKDCNLPEEYIKNNL
ncbi:MAG: gamma-glutamylcyclotransferase, partial [Candidatus Omnitrophica bacterium]|nr:gamma-glutamylcyclotransferase [Candidatus Omnitrophota bacterium]